MKKSRFGGGGPALLCACTVVTRERLGSCLGRQHVFFFSTVTAVNETVAP